MKQGSETSKGDLDKVFGALSDPTRREILRRLAAGPVVVGDLAKPFSMSLPAISRHLRVLQGSGLVAQDKQGRQRRCLLNPRPLMEATEWLDNCRDFWTRQFASLDQLFAEIQASADIKAQTKINLESEMSDSQKVVLKHVFNAKPETVFSAWTTPALMARWFDGGCDNPDAAVARDVKVDLRVGGKYELKMGQSDKTHHGEYREIKLNEKIVFTWNSPAVTNTLVTIEFKAVGQKTELTLTHELLPMEWRERHQKGWNNIFRNLDNVLAK